MFTTPPADDLQINLDGSEPEISYHASTSYLKPVQQKGMFRNQDFKFDEIEAQARIKLDLRRGLINEHRIYELGLFELSNEDQWNGQEPFKISSTGEKRITLTESPALFAIVTLNTATGERIRVCIGHNDKDHMFIILNRINAILEYGRQALFPWQDILENGGEIPIEELREVLSAAPPRFRFTPLPDDRRGEDIMELVRRYVTPLEGPRAVGKRAEEAAARKAAADEAERAAEQQLRANAMEKARDRKGMSTGGKVAVLGSILIGILVLALIA